MRHKTHTHTQQGPDPARTASTKGTIKWDMGVVGKSLQSNHAAVERRAPHAEPFAGVLVLDVPVR
jgi:hypothetical protein